ncbi:MAG: rhomboid family intramembrane serine protease [Deltaproteobacteria bacterium]|nr:rhomboid family intramembrane serine protease [Deltaproteobacteria bacterium]
MTYFPGRRGVSHGSRLSPAAAWLVGLELGFFLLYAFAGDTSRQRLEDWIGLTPRALLGGHLWKLFTTTLLTTRPLSLFFDILMLWMFVPVLEHFWGTRRFVVFVIATSFVGNLVSALVGVAVNPAARIQGLSPFIYASIAAYGVVFARQPVQFFGVFPMRGRTLAIGMAIFLFAFILMERNWVDGSGFFAAMGLAWVMTSGIFQPNVWWLRFRRWRIRRKYTVIDGGASRERKRWMN